MADQTVSHEVSDANLPIVLITGSSGFLGKAISSGLMDRYRATGLDAEQPRQPIEDMATVEIDLTSDSGWDRAID